MYLLAWILPAVLLLRMLEVYRVRNLTLSNYNHLQNLKQKLEILELTGKADPKNIGVNFLKRIIEIAVHDNPTLTIWSMFYINSVFAKKKKKEPNSAVIQMHSKIFAEIRKSPDLLEILNQLNAVSTYYIMNKSALVRFLKLGGKCYRGCSSIVTIAIRYRPVLLINRSVNQGFQSEMYREYLHPQATCQLVG